MVYRSIPDYKVVREEERISRMLENQFWSPVHQRRDANK